MNLLIWLLLALFLPILLFLLFYKVASISFVKLGIPKALVFLFFVLILLGSLVNIPVWYSHDKEPGFFFRQGHYFFFHPPQIQTVVVAMNVGGAIIPLLLSLYLLPKAPLLKTALALTVIALVTNLLARVEPGMGVTLPVFVTPLLSVGVALVIAWQRAAPVAYISGTLGTLIGADLLNLREVIDTGATYLSIGGAGIFDGIFLTGIIAVFLSPGEQRGGSPAGST